MIAPLIDETRAALERALALPELAAVHEAMDRLGVRDACDRLVGTITTANGQQAALAGLKDRVSAAVGAPVDGVFERALLLRHGARALDRVDALRVSDSVRRQFCQELQVVACPAPRVRFDVRRATFVGLCEVVTFRRFPAGQFHWSVSGLPRSWILEVRGRDRLRLIYWVARRLGGFAPAFFPHLNGHRRNRWLTELESNRSYYRMAETLRLQPEIKGMVAASWLRSPDTAKASPHLAWVNRTVEENGGLVLVMGMADPDSGVLARSAERQQMYEAGEFIPTTGLVIWPRDAMLAWAARHPELAD